MNGKEHREYIERMARNRLAEVHGDIWAAYSRAIEDLDILGRHVSTGLLRIAPHNPAGYCEIPPPSIEDPGTGVESQTAADA